MGTLAQDAASSSQRYEGHIAQRLSNLLPGLLGLHIGRDFVLFIRIPLGVFQQRKLAGEIAWITSIAVIFCLRIMAALGSA